MEKLEHFEILNNINVSDKIEKKDNLNYLSWAWAWGETKKKYPDAKYGILKNENNMPYFYDETGYVVYTWVEIEGLKHEMWLPVIDGKNKAMLNHDYEYDTKYGKKTVKKATMFDINKSLMRCLTKNLSMFGLGLYIYSGEDLPEVESNNTLWKQIKLKNKKSKEIVNLLYKKCKGDYSEALKVLNFFDIKSFKDLDNSPIDDLYNILNPTNKKNEKDLTKEQVKNTNTNTKTEIEKDEKHEKDKKDEKEIKNNENIQCLGREDIQSLEELAKSEISNYNHIELIDFVLIKLKEKYKTSTNLNQIPKKYLATMKNMISIYKKKKEESTKKPNKIESKIESKNK